MTPLRRLFSPTAMLQRGFTLIEVLIVAAIISIFAGLAVFAMQQMYDSNRQKAMYDETRSLGIAVSMARDDIGFFPRLHMLGKTNNEITFNIAGNSFILPAFDIYGTLTQAQQVPQVINNWNPPYTNVTEARRSFAQGTSLLIKMRLPEPSNINFPNLPGINDATRSVSLVDWPADTWGNPYMLYLIVSDTSIVDPVTNPLGLRLVNRAGERPNYKAMIVSYGPNHIPGGTDLRDYRGDENEYNTYVNDVLIPGALFTVGDSVTGNAYLPDGVTKIYTLKSQSPAVTGDQSLRTGAFEDDFPGTLYKLTNDPDHIGILDPGSDDIVFQF